MTGMDVDPSTSSRWMVDCADAMERCKQPLLHGNVADQFLLNGRYVTLLGFLHEYLLGAGYQVVGQYDVADGLVFAEEGMRREFEGIVSGRLLGRREAEQSPEPDERTPAQPAGPPPARGIPRPSPGRVGRTRGPFLQDPLEAMSQMRLALSQSEAPCAFIVRFADKLVTGPEHHQMTERQCLVSLAAALESASFIERPPLTGRRNALVLVASHLGDVPPWVYQSSPFVSVVPVPRPDRDEREHFLRQFLPNFEGGADLAPDEVDATARLFADLTDGLSAWDLDAVRRTSISEGIPVARMRELMAYFKHGQRQDPWEEMDAEKVRSAESTLSARVIGQPVAVGAVVEMLLAAKVGVTLSPTTAAAGKPKGVFFFVGPTGVGKTELAKALSEAVFGDDSAFARFDMSEYAEQHAAEKLTGAPPGFVGYEEGGHLTNRVRERPFSLLLFDEIEKAHPKIMDKFLQILEDGRLTDGQGQTAYFSQTVIIFTSNLGAATMPLGVAAEELPYEAVRQHFLDAVTEHFTRPPRADGAGGLGRPELLNRFGEGIIVFDILRAEHVRGIATKFLRALAASAQDRSGWVLEWDASVMAWLETAMRQGDNLLFGGRRIKTLIEAAVERPLNRWLFFNAPATGETLLLAMEGSPGQLAVNGDLATDAGGPA